MVRTVNSGIKFIGGTTLKTNHRRKNPPAFKRSTKELTMNNFKPSGAPNYSYMGYVARTRHGVEGMEHDGGHRGNARDIRETKALRRRISRRVANNLVLKSLMED